jgi:uncharacterized protein YjbJ (UPF0337 family)
MNEDRAIGTARNATGKIQEGLGSVMGDAKTQVEGITNQITSAAQDLYGQTRDAAASAAGAARHSASSFEKAVRNAIETQPYTCALIALGIGWILGRTHRPL